MTNPSENPIKPVLIKAGSQTQSLRYDPESNTIQMDPINIADLNLRDFTRIHSFFRRVQGLRYNLLQETSQSRLPPPSNPCKEVTKDGKVFADLEMQQVFETPEHPHAVLRKVSTSAAAIVGGSVRLTDEHYLERGVIHIGGPTSVKPTTSFLPRRA